ncbi:phosphoglycerate dehydrogenase-like enzyme [Evansella vedderi]|uniref:Phosphoglycerate dehydrogenase-like enzyme n=1 Tax=Evansella vedderi TaxID=38282 RepID=A0ABT9ZZX8_9BACI|nr:D-2-hydroxyacid dehydrogenase [Evansella vedderi]MDQ0256799.1 phosphoglycerate dehydrogenase-like enzyme [Evansella vedderi]
MEIKHILIVSPMHKEIEALLKTKNVPMDKEFRFHTEETVTEQDYDWADTFVSFKRPANFRFGNIKWVHSFGAGVDKIMKNIQWKEDVLLTRTICSFGEKISEYALSHLLRDLQNHDKYTDMQENKIWKEVAPIPMKEKKVVVFGTGVIGQEVARSLSFFGVNVYGVSLSGKQKEYFKEVYSSEGEGYYQAISAADYVINTMPLTKITEGIFNRAFFNALENAFFINVGRGESVDNGALLEALDKGRVRKAVLDVFPEEPLPKEDVFWTHPKVMVTPHISALTTAEDGLDCFLDTLTNIENDNEIPNLVDLKKGF